MLVLPNIVKLMKFFIFLLRIEDVRNALGKEVDVFDVTHIIPDSKISKEINKDGVVIYEK